MTEHPQEHLNKSQRAILDALYAVRGMSAQDESRYQTVAMAYGCTAAVKEMRNPNSGGHSDAFVGKTLVDDRELAALNAVVHAAESLSSKSTNLQRALDKISAIRAERETK